MQILNFPLGRKGGSYLLILLSLQISWTFYSGIIFDYLGEDQNSVESRLTQVEKGLLPLKDNQEVSVSQKGSFGSNNPSQGSDNPKLRIGSPSTGGTRDSSRKVGTLAVDPLISPIEDYVDNQGSDMDAVSDLGDLDNFANMQASDASYANLSESFALGVINYINFADATDPGSAQTMTINKPSGTQEDDFMLAIVASTILSDPDGSTMNSAPSGWTEENEYTNPQNPVSGQHIYIYWKIAGISEPSSYSWTWTDSCGWGGQIITFRGVDSDTPIHVEGTTDYGNSLDPNTPSITTAEDGSAVISFFVADDDDANPGNEPSSTTEIGLTETATGGNGLAINSAYYNQTTAGSTGDRIWTGALGANEEWIGEQYALLPAPIPGDYNLEQEVQFGSVIHFLETEQLCIETGSFGGTEDLNVTVWNGSTWSSIASDLTASSWNNFTVAINTTTFTIKFGGSITSSDSTQDWWQIDAVLLQLNGTGINETYVMNDDSNIDSAIDHGDLQSFSNMKNADASYAILNESAITNSWDAPGGSGNYLQVGPGGPEDFGYIAGTISLWIKFNTISGRFWGQHADFELRFSGNNLVFDWGADTTLSYAHGFSSTDTWYFWAVTWTESGTDLYVYEGDENTQPMQVASKIDWTTPVRSIGVPTNNIMNSRNGPYEVDGHIADFRVYDTDRSLSAIQSDYQAVLTGSESNLQHYYKFDNSLADSAGSIGLVEVGSSGSYSTDAPLSYRLDQEVQWTDIPYQLPYEELCIYTGSTATEDLSVDVWNGSGWKTIIPAVRANSWNNVSVHRYLNSSTFAIRFVDGIQLSDTNQNDWKIEAVTLTIWNPIPTGLTAWSHVNATTVSTVYYNPTQKYDFFIQWEDTLHNTPINATKVESNSSKVMRGTNETLGGHSLEFLPNATGINALNAIKITLSRQAYEPLIYTIAFDVQVTPTSWSSFGPTNGTTISYDKTVTLWMIWNDSYYNELISGGKVSHNGSAEVSNVPEVAGNYSLVWHLNYTSRLPLPQTWVLNVTLSHYGYENRSLMFEISLQKSPTAEIAKWPSGTTIWLNYTDQYTFWVQWQDSDGVQGSSTPVWINDTDNPLLNDSFVTYLEEDSNPGTGNHTFIFDENGTLLPGLHIIGIIFGNATHADTLYELQFLVDYTPTGGGEYSYVNGSTVLVAYNDSLEFFIQWQDLNHSEWLFADGFIDRGDLELVSLIPSSGNHSFRFNSRNKAIGIYPYTIAFNKTGDHGYKAFSYYITFVVTENPSSITDWSSRPFNATVVTLDKIYAFWLLWTDMNRSTPIAGASATITGNGSTKIQELTHSGGIYYFRFWADQQAFFEVNISLNLAGYSSVSHSFNFTVLFLHTAITDSSVLNGTTINLQYADIYSVWIVWNDTDNNAWIEDSAPEILDTDHITLAEVPSNGNHTFQFSATQLGLLAVSITFEVPGYEAQQFVISFQIASNPTVISNSQYDSDATVSIRYSDICEFWLVWQDSYHSSLANDTNAAITGSYTTQLTMTESGNHTFCFTGFSVGSFEVNIILEATGYEPTSYRIFFLVESNPTTFSDTNPAAGSIESVPFGRLFDFHIVWHDAKHSIPISGALILSNETTLVAAGSTSGGYYPFTFNSSLLGSFGVNITLTKTGYDTISFLFTIIVIPSPTTLYASSIPYNTTVWMYYGDDYIFWARWWDVTTSVFIADNTPYAFGSGTEFVEFLEVSQVSGNHTFRFAGSVIGTYFVALTFGLNDPEHASTAIVLWFDVRLRPTTIHTMPEIAFPDSAMVETIITAQYNWEDNAHRPVSGANVMAYWNNTAANKISFIELSPGIYNVSISTGEISWGPYNLTLWFSEYGYANQSVEIYISIIGLTVELQLIIPDTIVRGEDYVLEAHLYRSQSSRMALFQASGVPVVNKGVNFVVTVLHTNGTEITYQETVFTGSTGIARFVLARDTTKNIKNIQGISADFSGSGLYIGAKSTILSENFPSVESKPRAVPLIEQLRNWIIENIVYIILSMLALLGLLAASSYKLVSYQKIKRRHQAINQALQEIRLLRMVIIRHKDGVGLFSKSMFGAERDLDQAISGMSAAISAFMEGISAGRIEGTGAISLVGRPEFVRHSQEGLHMLQRNGVHTAVIIISEGPLGKFTEANMTKLQLEIEQRFEPAFARFFSNEQIPGSQLEELVSYYLYIGLLGPIQLNETKLRLEESRLTPEGQRIVWELRAQKELVPGEVLFVDSYISHLRERGIPTGVAAKFLLKAYRKDLVVPTSSEVLTTLNR